MAEDDLISSKKKFIEAFIAAKKEFKKITKDTRGVHNSKHARLEECIDAIEPALNKHGIVSSHQIKGRKLIVKLMHVDGHEEVSERDLPEITGKGNPAHEEGGAMTYFRRYDYLGITNQQPEGEDTDATSTYDSIKSNAPGKISEKQLNRLYAIAQKNDWNQAHVMTMVQEHRKKSPSELTWGDEYNKVVEYFESNKNPNPR